MSAAAVNPAPWPAWFRPRPRPADEVVAFIARDFDVPLSLMFDQNRNAEYVTPRHVAFYTLRRRNLSFGTIGRLMRRDHKTIMHGIDTIAKRIKHDDALAVRVVRAIAFAEGRR